MCFPARLLLMECVQGGQKCIICLEQPFLEIIQWNKKNKLNMNDWMTENLQSAFINESTNCFSFIRMWTALRLQFRAGQ